jgi:hypothetical protein
VIKSTPFILAFIAAVQFSCQKNDNPETPAPAERYKDEIFSSVTKTTVQFDVQLDYSGNPTTLLADLYQPAGDLSANRAIIIYVHGGGFVGGTRDGENIPYFCDELAKRGYVVASIDYRLGVADASAAAKGRAQIRAIQDLKSFIRYTKQNAATVKADINKIFISGGSAGGATALATAFMDYGEQPAYMNPTSVTELQGNGNINGNNASVKAVYSLWGAVSDTTWINAGNIPVGCIQSISDPCIAWDYIASSCNVPGYGSYGSHAINTRAKNLGIYTSLYGYNSNVHDLGMSFPYIDTTIKEMTNFLYSLAR